MIPCLKYIFHLFFYKILTSVSHLSLLDCDAETYFWVSWASDMFLDIEAGFGSVRILPALYVACCFVLLSRYCLIFSHLLSDPTAGSLDRLHHARTRQIFCSCVWNRNLHITMVHRASQRFKMTCFCSTIQPK